VSRQILERMVTDMVQVQLAKENGIKIDDATLDKTIERIAQENNLALPAFRAAIEKDGIRFPRFARTSAPSCCSRACASARSTTRSW
jgi:peptidyl-prolyl cis-trans isomerase SurA